ncbi:MAG: peptidase C25, partial [Flavobacteriaceae bacterium]|nr:peptidase C25 [Flavobacteriaceae bacterium]
MRKIVLLLAICCISITISAQNKSISITWESSAKQDSRQLQPKANSLREFSAEAVKALRLVFDQEELLYTEQWPDTGYVNAASAQLTNVQYADLTTEELARLNRSLVPDRLTFSLSTAIARNEMKTILQLVPIVRQKGVYKKITSFNVSYGRSNAPLGGNRMPLTNSVLASGDWFKFKVEKNGVFQITKSFLESLGMNTNAVNPQNLKVYGHGGKPLPYLNRVDAPIDLPQTPIQVVGGEDESFDAGDYLLFYGTSTIGYDPENDTNLNPYSDDSYYYITSSGGPGLRIQEFTQP